MINKKILIQVSALILISGVLSGMIFYTEIFDDVRSRIVSVLCLSCIKLNPLTSLDFVFETANDRPHPYFVLHNLTKGPIFLSFRKDICEYCDIMEPVVQDIFDIYFEKEETFVKTIDFNGSDIIFIHINTDHAPNEMVELLHIYNKDKIGGEEGAVPMFTVITLGYERGFIKPYYTTGYGLLNRDTNEERKELLTNLIVEAIFLYNENRAGYNLDEMV